MVQVTCSRNQVDQVELTCTANIVLVYSTLEYLLIEGSLCPVSDTSPQSDKLHQIVHPQMEESGNLLGEHCIGLPVQRHCCTCFRR